MRHLTTILLVFLLALMPSCKNFKGKRFLGLFGRKADTMVVWLAKQKSLHLADSIRKVNEHLQAIEQARQDSIRMAEEALAALSSKYNIVVGSFITPEYAKAWADEYRNRGFNPQIIKMDNSRFELVVAETHDKLGEAATRLNQFQDTMQIDAWIYRKK